MGARIDDTNPKKYGYAFTDAALSTQMTDFHTKLSQNIETFVRRQYCPTTTFMTSSIDLGERITSTTPALQYAAKVK